MKTEYHLEIYEPDDSGCVAASYESSTPFGALKVGDAIHGGSMNLSDTNKTVRVKDIQHISGRSKTPTRHIKYAFTQSH